MDIALNALPKNGQILNKKYRLWIIGSNFNYELLKVNKNVEYLGKKSHDEVIELMKKADLLLVPSRADNSPNVIIEAQLNKLPVLASKVGGIPELFNSHDISQLFEPCPEAMLQALEKFVHNPLSDHHLESNRNIASKRHNSKRIVELHLKVYDELLKVRA